MNPEDVVNLLQRLGELLSPTAQRVWEVTRAQVIVDANVARVTGALCLVLGAVGIGLAAHIWRRAEASDLDWEYPEARRIVALGIGLVALIILLVAYGSITSSYKCLANPDYCTMMRLVSLARGG